MNSEKRREIFTRFRAANPHPASELRYATPFELLISVILSAQATDKSVNLATEKLYKIANTPQQMLALGQGQLERHVQSIGLYRTKAKNIIATCRLLLEQYDGAVPADLDALQRLPGVGRKTANVIMNTAFGQPTIAVDTHIFRVANRTRIAPGKNVIEVENRLMKCVAPEFRQDAHHWLILHGRYICVARKPKCQQCLIRDLCEYPAKTTADDRRDAK